MAQTRLNAEDLAKEQRSISISEFFLKNKHLLGFDNPRKALVTTIKEAVDNSLDATEQIGVTPEIKIKVTPVSAKRFKIVVEDNGPGIVREQIPKIFAKLLYGSKFDKLKSTRGQQGIGICMTPDTLIPLGDGKVLPIKEIVENNLDNDLFVPRQEVCCASCGVKIGFLFEDSALDSGCRYCIDEEALVSGG